MTEDQELFEALEDENTEEATTQETTGQDTQEYDWEKLDDSPEGVAYERENLDGQTVTIKKASIIKPFPDDEWEKAMKDKNTEYKRGTIRVDFDTPNNDREHYSGVKFFKQKDGKMSPPNLYWKGKNQVSKIYQAYALYKGVPKDKLGDRDAWQEHDVGPRSFMAFLNSRPKAKIEWIDIEYDGKIWHKNMIKSFVKED